MACMDRDFAAYLAMESQRTHEAAIRGNDPGQLSFNPDNVVDQAILERALMQDPGYMNAADDAARAVIRSKHETLKIALDGSDHQVNVRWGSVQSSKANRVEVVDDTLLDRTQSDRVSITILDQSPNYFERLLPTTGGVTQQTQSILRVLLEYKNERSDSDIAAAWACKLEEYFSAIRNDVFPSISAGDPLPDALRLRAASANVTWHIRNDIGFVRRDSSFVALSLQLAAFYRLVDGMRIDSAIFTASSELVAPIDLMN